MNRLWAVISTVTSLALLAIGLVLIAAPFVGLWVMDTNQQWSACCAAFLMLPGGAFAWIGLDGLRTVAAAQRRT